MANQTSKLLAQAFYFHDVNLYSIIEDIYKLASIYGDLYDELVKQAKSQNVEGIEQVMNKIRELPTELIDLNGRFLARIDMIKIDAREQFKEIKKSDDLRNHLREMREKSKE